MRCEIYWMHKFGTEVEMLQENEGCTEFRSGVADLEIGLELGLAPALVPGVQNLLELLN